MSEIVVAIIGLVGGIITMILKEFFDNRKRKTEKESLNLKYHPVFARLDSLSSYVKNGFHVENKGKEVVFKFILEKWFSIWKDNLLVLCEKIQECHNICERDDGMCTKLYNLNIDFINNSYDSCTNFYLDSSFTQDEKLILSIVMDKFNIWNNSRISHMQDNVNNICNSKFYDDCVVKQAVILDLYIGFFIDVMEDAEITFNSINGDLSGLRFKDVVI